jgi:hypothetical protein
MERLQHLNRLTLEHPAGVTRARAGYWTARVLFEKNDVQRACAVNADALAQTNPNDVELRNQISLSQSALAQGVVMASSTPADLAERSHDRLGSQYNREYFGAQDRHHCREDCYGCSETVDAAAYESA